ncbi:hypothetical protein BJY04DRAFT_99214 [Aspergillus karnatakaensis]|uniref:DUF4291 domain-containing protein n=1 Tax=Aspergillus karnatakaensis TaxID=1810916 RepID=UPI003CCD4564
MPPLTLRPSETPVKDPAKSLNQPQSKNSDNNLNLKTIPYRQIRAVFTPTTITVYQAYPPSIATAAITTQSFTQVPGFKMERMTWIKPSFLWMAYRSGYASKKNQERVLAIEISRDGFEWALSHACLSHVSKDATKEETREWKKKMEECPVRVQWDPERDLWGNPLTWRSLQVGLKGEAVERYVNEWIVGVRDVTGVMHEIEKRIGKGDVEGATGLLPAEEIFEGDQGVGKGIGMIYR